MRQFRLGGTFLCGSRFLAGGLCLLAGLPQIRIEALLFASQHFEPLRGGLQLDFSPPQPRPEEPAQEKEQGQANHQRWKEPTGSPPFRVRDFWCDWRNYRHNTTPASIV